MKTLNVSLQKVRKKGTNSFMTAAMKKNYMTLIEKKKEDYQETNMDIVALVTYHKEKKTVEEKGLFLDNRHDEEFYDVEKKENQR